MKLRTSVSHRLFLLVGCQTAVAALLFLTAARTNSAMAGYYRHMHDYQLKALTAIAQAIQQTTAVENAFNPAELEAFYRRYRHEWETAAAVTPDAIRFRQDILRTGGKRLMQIESDAISDLQTSLQNGNLQRVKADLNLLYDVNVQFAEYENRDLVAESEKGRWRLLTVGLSGIGLTLFMGLNVRRAIGPRIKRMVGHVREFQKSRNYERIGDTGKDDIAVLANALDAGFSAIALGEHDREEFLAIAAHELKTPVASILGFSSLLAHAPNDVVDLHRALDIIYRQSWRLSRLIEALFLAMRARSGNLEFRPQPLDISALVQRVLEEMEPFLSKRTFSAHIQTNISMLGDRELLEHALWSLFTCAAALSCEKDSIDVFFEAIGHQARLAVDLKRCDISVHEIHELFIPFRFIQYETGKGIRSAVGLYLCREIVRVHNGRMLVQEASELQPEFLVELPI